MRAAGSAIGPRRKPAIRTSTGITVITAVVVVALLFWFLNKTRTGKSMRAYSDNEDLALLSGINPERVVLITWTITAALATIAQGVQQTQIVNLAGLLSNSGTIFTS